MDFLDPFSFRDDVMTTLNKILEAVRTLSPEKREQLRSILNSAEVGTSPPKTEQAFADSMANQGILERPLPSGERPSFQPAPTQGKPASEIIIEERR